MPEIIVPAFGGIIVVPAGGIEGIAEAAALGQVVRSIETGAPFFSQGFVVLQRGTVGERPAVSIIGKSPQILSSNIIQGRVFLAVRSAGTVTQVGSQPQASPLLPAYIPEGSIGPDSGTLGRGQAMGEPLRTVDFQLFPEGFRGARRGGVGPGIIEGRAHVEPEISVFLLEFQVGSDIVLDASSTVVLGRDQVSFGLESGTL